MALLRFVVRRILRGALALVAFLFIVYMAVGSLIPNDANSLFPVMTQADLEGYRARLGVGEPLIVQFGIWVRGMITGDLGRTTFGAPIASRIGDALARTAFVFTAGIPVAYVFGGWLGRRSGWKRKPGSDATTLVAVVLGTAFPPFLAFVLTVLLREQSTLLADWRRAAVGTSRVLWIDSPLAPTDVLWALIAAAGGAVIVVAVLRQLVLKNHRAPPSVTLAAVAGVAVAGWIVLTDLERHALDLVFAALVPLVAFTILSFGEFMVVGQAAVASVRDEDFVLAARAKGLSRRRVRDVHGGSSAQLVMLSRLAISLPYLLTGLVIIEQAVDWPGLGDFLFQALQGRDLPTIMSSLLVIGALAVVSRVMLDVLQQVLDPRLGEYGGWV